ncbi:hypothetical protein CASFOL_006144 [Castilleja foliolosa]|uniref:Uncharacterized protein n=1 Tax=Castilleja foliolosa TaxID=1961234 RepID=A0ABD3E6I2_9LAMI
MEDHIHTVIQPDARFALPLLRFAPSVISFFIFPLLLRSFF